MTTPKEALWQTLGNLTNDQFKNFKWFLKQGHECTSFLAISEAQLEGADRPDTIDLMVQKHGYPRALQLTTEILEKISRNDLVQDLTNNYPSPRKNLKEDLKNSADLPCDDERRKAKLSETKANIDLMIKERQMKICEIRCSAELSRKSAKRQTADSLRVFGALVVSVQSCLDKLLGQIEEKQKMAQEQAEGLVQKLEQEISELTKRSAEVEQLCLTKDQNDFLPSLLSTDETLTEVGLPQPSYNENMITTVNELKEKLSKDMEMFLIKAELNRVQQFAVDVTLDPDTAHPNLILSNDRKQVHCGDREQNLPKNPERFVTLNALGKQSFSSRSFYYEVQVEGKTSWDLGVAKESINRKENVNVKPENGFWAICLRKGGMYRASAIHLSVKIQPRKVGVFVDYEKRSVSFYNAESAELIHCYTDCSFSEKLYPFISPGTYHKGQNSTPLIICPVSYHL
ncbi:pyrin-like [Archocentrus centrarchus]|uniref:pyrin-like n=1 Tax=Archocentrus centrarchus TaxID=63155 RepID=UPI0011EA1FE7|nr:pyrin-like [Archocentrus centrarchus]XP_030576161.1 pyrin-like [Archocentrus centrarchus]XP_030576162.1 pyrin-like [Archocentrus centrarchus]XP_030576163.1 pyrin-like [Archocentrus centrarchus]XP_030576164.1 pyrin-like [Archocentrus centrarchus]